MSQRLNKEELDEQFELFLKESVSDDSVDLGGSEKQPCAKSSQKSTWKPAASWWQDDEDSGGAERELSGSGKSFRKSLRKSHAIQEEDDDPRDTGVKEGAAVFSRDDTKTEGVESMKVPAVNINTMGLDTLEEEEEKACFFAQLEAEASSTIDYSKLNREFDSMSSTIGSNLRNAEEAVEQNDVGQRKARVTETISLGSPHYSEDFEDEENGKDPLQEKSEMPPSIAKVCLFDSLDDTGGEDRKKDTAGSLDRGHSYVKSGASEMEALHEAYRQIQVVEGSDDHNHDHLHSTEEGERLHRSVSSTFAPQHDRQSLQPASTNESDLPTAEELMRPIRIEDDHTRGFSLQPVSALQRVQEKTSCSLERTFPDVSYAESQLKRPKRAATKIKGANELLSHRCSSPDHPNPDLTWSIREEVQRLMKDHNEMSSHKPSQAGKIKKQPASRSSTISQPSKSSVRKPTLPPSRGRKMEERTAVTSRSSEISKTAAAAKTHSPQRPSSATFIRGPERDDNTAESGLKVSNELVASVQSLVAVLQQQINTSSDQETRPTYHLPNNSGDESSSLVTELRVDLAQRERELQKMNEGAEELSSLRKQIFLLQSKLRSAEEANQRKKQAEGTDPAAEEKLQRMDKELKEQELLIKGYQQENEKLYLQMKAQQAKSKAYEESMFTENQTLLNELTFTRKQLSKTSRPVGNVCLMDHAQRITDLLSQINTFQRNEVNLTGDIHRLKKEKHALEEDLQLMKKERDLAKAQAISTSGDKTLEMRVLEEKHKEEVSGLKKKLQWFAENQGLLDRDGDRLQAASAQIHQLTEQVEKLKEEVGKRSSVQQRKAKEKTVDTKRMQDLQRQVKDLEQILKHRNPNSLPALIYAAASAGAEEDVDTAKTPNSIVVLQEARIQRLEAELESHDEEAKRSLKAMEQQFLSVKLRYEQQISALEQQLEQKQQVEEVCSAAVNQPWMSQVQTLEKALQQEKESHLEKEKSLHDQIESLQQQLKNEAQPSPSRHQRQAQEAFGVRIERLKHEVATKTQTIQELTRTVERLQKERRNMLSVPNPTAKDRSTENIRQPNIQQTKMLCSVTAKDTRGEEELFPAAHNERTYQPTVYAGSHISEVLQENQALTQRLELLELQAEQEKKELKAGAVQAEEELRRLQEHCAEQLSSLKVEHLRVLDQLRATYALEHSSSKVAEQAHMINTQEIKIKHLQAQVGELQGNKDALRVSRSRENILERQLIQLLQELKEAKEAQSSEVKLLCSLERKILNLDLRQQHRETELQQVINGTRQKIAPQQQAEVEHWKNLLQVKKKELMSFYLELDSILDVVKQLKITCCLPPDHVMTTHKN